MFYKDPISAENEHNLDICLKVNSEEVGKCLLQCGGQLECEQDCNNKFNENYENCPCQVNIKL